MSQTLEIGWPIIVLIVGAAVFRVPPGPETPAATFCASPFSETAQRIEECLTHDPSNVGLLTALAVTYEKTGRTDAAEAAYRRAIAVDPRDGELHRRLATLFSGRGDAVGGHENAAIANRWQPGRGR